MRTKTGFAFDSPMCYRFRPARGAIREISDQVEGERLLQSIKIRNLRGLRSLDLAGFSHVNLLTGLNGAGKTTLLEAVFLNCGASNAGLATKLSLFRDDFEITPFNDRFFEGLFPYLNATEPVHIEVKGDSRKKLSRAIRSLKITARFKQ